MKKGQYRVMIIIIGILAAFFIYTGYIHPWEREKLFVHKADLTVTVIDCTTLEPISGAEVIINNLNDQMVNHAETESTGAVRFELLYDCYNIIVRANEEKTEKICVDPDEVVNRYVCVNKTAPQQGVLLSTEGVGIIGSSQGQEISTHTFNDVTLDYKVVNETTQIPGTTLLSNIIWSEKYSINLTGDFGEDTKRGIMGVKIIEKTGNPQLKVSVEGVTLYQGASNATANVIIPQELLVPENKITISCIFSGLEFWQTQKCKLSTISLTQQYYTPIKTSEERIFSLSEQEINSAVTKIEAPLTSRGAGNLTIKINNKTIFEGNDLEIGTYEGTSNSKSLELKEEGNTLLFLASKGTVYDLILPKVKFFAENASEVQKKISFEISDEVWQGLTKIKALVYIESTYVDGEILIETPRGYEYPLEVSAGWNEIVMEPEDFKEGTNIITLKSNGRHKINQLIIQYE